MKFLKQFKKNNSIPTLWYNDIVLMKNSSLVEIGAMSGNISFYAWKTFGTKNIYAVEAIPAHYEKLVSKFKETPIQPVNVAIGDKNGEVSFFVYGLHSSSSLFDLDSHNKYSRELKVEEKIQVRSVTIETFMEEHKLKHINCLIMNCEGAEEFILPQIVNSEKLITAIDQISIELHPMILGQRRILELIRLLWPHYECRVITRNIRGPSNAIFTRRETPTTTQLPYFILQHTYAAVMDALWPILRYLKNQALNFTSKEAIRKSL
ncbi:FkbM family methyltransferase [Candidatus Omnitrophota bacterium]